MRGSVTTGAERWLAPSSRRISSLVKMSRLGAVALIFSHLARDREGSVGAGDDALEVRSIACGEGAAAG